MITRSEAAAPKRSGRILRLAVAASVCVHLLVLLAAFGFYDVFERALVHRPLQHVKRDDETVTLSTAIHFEKRPRAAATHAGRAAGVQPPKGLPPQLRPAARVALVKQPRTPRKAAPQAPPRRRELAKIAPRATPLPPTVRASSAATAPPRGERRQQLALLEHPSTTANERPRQTTLGAARLARLQRDLAASIAQDRARENPLSNVAHRVNPASTIRRYTINVAGSGAKLRGAQGLCNPLRTWTASGFVYFNVTCRTQHPDGSVRDEVIPWPLRFRPDQISYGPQGPAPPPGQIPLPLAGWRLPAPQYVDPDVLNFLRERGYPV